MRRSALFAAMIAAAALSGCTLPDHIAESMTDYKLCDVHRWTVMHGFANDDATRETVDEERARRGLEPCTGQT